MKQTGLFNSIRACLILLFFVYTWCLADDVALSMDQVLSLFYQRNLDLIAAQYNVAQSRAEEIIAAAIPNPTLGVDIEQIAPRNNDRLGPYHSFSLTELIQTAGKRTLKIESSRLGSEAAEEDLQDAIRTLSNIVRKTYFNLLMAQKNIEIAEDNRKRYQELLKINHLRLQQGDIAEADYLRIEVEKLKAETDWNNANAAVTSARSEFAKLLAWPENALNFTAKEEWPSVKAMNENLREDALIDKALHQRPDIAAAHARIVQAEKQFILAKRSVIPDVTVGVAYNHDPQNTQADFAGVTMSVPLPLFYQQQGEISKANINLNTAKLNLAQTEQQLKTEVISAFAKMKAADQIVKRYNDEVLNKIDTIRAVAEFSYNKGATSLIELIDSERAYKSALLDYYTALNNRSQTYADLQMALGEK